MAITPKSVKKLREIYLDEFVIIHLKDVNVVTVDENNNEVKIAGMIEGYVIDIDTNFYYLGLPDGSITKTIGHETAQIVEIQVQNNEFLMQDMPQPDEDVH